METGSLIEKIEQEFEDMPKGALKADSAFKEVLNWNSINSVVLSAMIEFEYNVLLTPDDFKSVVTVTELRELVERKRNP